MVFIFLGPQRKLSPLPFSVERQKMKFEASNQFYGVRIFNSPMKPKDGGGIWTINKNNWHLEILTVLIQSYYSIITTLSFPQTKLAELKQKTNILWSYSSVSDFKCLIALIEFQRGGTTPLNPPLCTPLFWERKCKNVELSE